MSVRAPVYEKNYMYSKDGNEHNNHAVVVIKDGCITGHRQHFSSCVAIFPEKVDLSSAAFRENEAQSLPGHHETTEIT